MMMVYVLFIDTRNDGIPSQRTTQRVSPYWFRNLTSCVKSKVYYLTTHLTNMIEDMNTKLRRHATKWARGPRTTTRAAQRAFISALALQAVMAHTTTTGKHKLVTSFDTDSEPIGVDNRCTACISHVSTDFVGPLTDSGRTIRGFAGSRTVGIQVGTLRWSWSDDQGRIHTFNIPKSYYVPQGGVRLLSPQHWVKHTNKSKWRHNTGCDTNDKETRLYWNSFELTVLHNAVTNVPDIHMAPGFSKFDAFCLAAGVEEEDDSDHIMGDTTVVSNSEDSDEESMTDEERLEEDEDKDVLTHTRDPITGFSLSPDVNEVDEAPAVIEDEEERQTSSTAAEMLHYHNKFNHASFKKLRILAKHGVIPRRLAKCPNPVCSACMYGKVTRRPWRTRSSTNQDEALVVPSRPGQVVSADQLTSPTPGLIAQISGILTTKRYKYVTVFVDHFSDLSFVCLQKTTSAKETLEAKRAFKEFAASRGCAYCTIMPTMVSFEHTSG
jgi:hypothetical protein